MTGTVDLLTSRRILLLASNPAISGQTGWPIGFWWAELSHPYWEFTEHGYSVDIVGPEGGELAADPWSDPRDESGYSASDLITLGFINSPDHLKLVQETRTLADVAIDDYEAVFLVGGQAPGTGHRGEQLHRAWPFPPARGAGRSADYRAAAVLRSRCRTAGHRSPGPMSRSATQSTRSMTGERSSHAREMPDRRDADRH